MDQILGIVSIAELHTYQDDAAHAISCGILALSVTLATLFYPIQSYLSFSSFLELYRLLSSCQIAKTTLESSLFFFFLLYLLIIRFFFFYCKLQSVNISHCSLVSTGFCNLNHTGHKIISRYTGFLL